MVSPRRLMILLRLRSTTAISLTESLSLNLKNLFGTRPVRKSRPVRPNGFPVLVWHDLDRDHCARIQEIALGDGTVFPRPYPQTAAGGSGGLPRIMSDAFSATIIVGALVLQEGTNGMTDASTTRSPSIPRNFRSGATTAFDPLPIAQVPAG
jgi:hypothetical protein